MILADKGWGINEKPFPNSSFKKGFKKNIIPGFQIGLVAFW